MCVTMRLWKFQMCKWGLGDPGVCKGVRATVVGKGGCSSVSRSCSHSQAKELEALGGELCSA